MSPTLLIKNRESSKIKFELSLNMIFLFSLYILKVSNGSLVNSSFSLGVGWEHKSSIQAHNSKSLLKLYLIFSESILVCQLRGHVTLNLYSRHVCRVCFSNHFSVVLNSWKINCPCTRTKEKPSVMAWFSLAHKHKHKPIYADAVRC